MFRTRVIWGDRLEAAAELAAVDDIGLGDSDLGDRGPNNVVTVPTNSLTIRRSDSDCDTQTAGLFTRGSVGLVIVEVRVVFFSFVGNEEQDLRI